MWGFANVVLRELATELTTQLSELRSVQGRARAAIISLNHATDFLGRAPTQSVYRGLRERHPELKLMSDTTVRRALGHIPWQDCLRRAFAAAPTCSLDEVAVRGEAFTEDEVRQALRGCVDERGGDVPTFNDYLAWASDPAVRARPGRRPLSLSVFLRFGGFRACLVRLGLAVDALQRVDKAGRVVPLRRGYTDDEMREAVRAVASELGRTPLSADYRDARAFRLRYSCPADPRYGRPGLHMDLHWPALSYYPHALRVGRPDLHVFRLAMFARRNACEALISALKLSHKLGLDGAARRAWTVGSFAVRVREHAPRTHHHRERELISASGWACFPHCLHQSWLARLASHS